MSRKVTVDGLADAISRELKEYAQSTSESVKAAVKKTGKAGIQQLQILKRKI